MSRPVPRDIRSPAKNRIALIRWSSLMRRLRASLDALPVLRALGRALYHATAHCTSVVCWTLPDVRAVYTTGSMATGDIAPGLSDIDLVVVIRDLPPDREFRLIGQLETRLKFIMPPLGQHKSGTHLMIYSMAEWESVGRILLGKRAGRPAVLFDRRRTRAQGAIGSRTLCLHHFLKAGWRLDDMQKDLTRPSADRLDALLRRRMVDRLLGALENACEERGVSPGSQAELSLRVSKVRFELAHSQAQAGEIILPHLLSSVLACFDLAMEDGWQGYAGTDPDGPWSDAHEPSACVNAAASAELAGALCSRIGDRLADHSVWVARIGSADFVVCEPLTSAAARTLIEDSLASPGRTMYLMSPRMLSGLYLNDDWGPLAFVRLGDLRTFGAVGPRSPERALLEAYAMFPRVRALRKLDDLAIFDAYRTGITRLLDRFNEDLPGDHRLRDDESRDPDLEGAACAATVGSDSTLAWADDPRAARYHELRRLSRDLQRALSRWKSSVAGGAV